MMETRDHNLLEEFNPIRDWLDADLVARYRTETIPGLEHHHVREVAISAEDVQAIGLALFWLVASWDFVAHLGMVDGKGGAEQQRVLPLERLLALADRYAAQ